MGMVGHYHEDDFGMREILPIEFWAFCEVQIEMMEEEAAKHFLGSEAGWSQVNILAEKPKELAGLAMRRSEIVKVLGTHLPQYERIETGSFSYAVPTERNEGFGFSPWIGIFFDFDQNEIVRQIWLVPGGTTDAERNAFVNAFTSLSTFGSFLFVDWLRGELMRADDRAALMRYFRIAAGEESDDGD